MPSEGLRYRINRVAEGIKRLEKLSQIDENAFFMDFRNIDSLERNLQIIIEGMLDIGNFIITNLNLESPTTYFEVGQILLKNQIISKRAGDILSNLAKFRNVIVHGYAEISEKQIYELFKEKFNELRYVFNELIKAIEKNKLDP